VTTPGISQHVHVVLPDEGRSITKATAFFDAILELDRLRLELTQFLSTPDKSAYVDRFEDALDDEKAGRM